MTPALHGTGGANVIFGDRGSHAPIFSSADQILHTDKCVGNLQFLKPLKPSAVFTQKNPDGERWDVYAPQYKWVITSKGVPTKSIPSDDSEIPIGLKVGGNGPGSDDMKTNEDYANFGPHFLGTYEPNIGPTGEGIYCIKPSAVEVSKLDFSRVDPNSAIKEAVALKALPANAF